MQLAILLAALLACANSQIIFPDEFDSLVKSYATSQQFNASAYSIPSNSVSMSFGSPAVPEAALGGETFLPPIADSPSAALPSGPNVAQVQFDQSNDLEGEYWSNHVNNILATGLTKFALDMDRAIYRSLEESHPGEKPNVVFSPLSLVSTLAMILLGSAGVTFEQVSKILGLESGVDISSHSELVHLMLGLVFKSIYAKPNSLGPEVTMASSIFVQKGFPIREEFMAISKEAYNNEVINLDFVYHPNEARRSVNEWVNSRTRGKISTILDDPIDPNTRLIIASALYFSGEWNQYFYPRATARKPFAVTPNETVMVDMMYNGGHFPFYEDPRLRVKIIGLPYKGYEESTKSGTPPRRQAVMYVLLPTAKDANALKRLENRLTVDNLEGLIGNMTDEICVLGIPRMKLSSNLNLNKPLKSLGLASLFDPATSNLGLLSKGYNETVTDTETPIKTRLGGDDESTGGKDIENSPYAGIARRNNYFRYEDKRGGYNVEQWDSGVLIEKIPQSLHRKRSIDESLLRDYVAGESTRKGSVSYDVPTKSTDKTKLKFVDIEDRKYRFDSAPRSKRQGRPIDEDFVRFVQSRKAFPNYGLDALRNSPNLENPGLFASDVLHKVEMDVTETGTTAAAVTGTSIQRGGDIKLFRADRPFLFFVRHEPSKFILFWGTVNKPTPNY